MDDRLAKPAVIRFGEFELDLCTAQLRTAGMVTKLQPQPAKVLALLAAHPGTLVSREQIRQQVWGDDTFVDFEQGLNFCIRQIRTVLGDDAESPRFVETLPRRGYRFLATVETVSTSPVEAIASALRIGVMPFHHLGPGAEQDYFSEGLTEEMITALSRLAPGRLRVVARTTMAQCQRKGMDLSRLRRELRLNYLLEGNVRRSADRVRIGTDLIDVADETLVWAETYERRLNDLFTIQAEVAARVARSLALELLPATQRVRSVTRSPAHEAYLKGRFFANRITGESLVASRRCFEEAIAADSNYAPAYAGLADCYAQMGSIRVAMITAAEALIRARPMAVRALELDDALPEAHNALAVIKCWYELDWEGAGQEFRRALALDPDNVTHAPWYAMYLIAIGQPEKALAEIYRAREIDPLSTILNTYVGAIQLNAGQFDLALRQLRETISLDPSYYRPYFFRGLTLKELGNYEEALSAFREAEVRAPHNLEVIAFAGRLHAYMGDRAGAEGSLHRLIEKAEGQYDPALLVAMIYAELGDIETAFAWIERAIERRASPLYFLRIYGTFDRLHGNSRYKSCLLRIGLPAYPVVAVNSG
jgi:TolB-like protein/Tfp pilus assembly protein PilF